VKHIACKPFPARTADAGIGRALMSKPKFLSSTSLPSGIAPLLVKTIFEKIVEINLRTQEASPLAPWSEQNATSPWRVPSTVTYWNRPRQYFRTLPPPSRQIPGKSAYYWVGFKPPSALSLPRPRTRIPIPCYLRRVHAISPRSPQREREEGGGVGPSQQPVCPNLAGTASSASHVVLSNLPLPSRQGSVGWAAMSEIG